MALFNRKSKKVQEESINSEERANQAVEKYGNIDTLFIILSIEQADLLKGISIPHIGQREDGKKTLYLYSSIDWAKEYMDKQGIGKLEEIYAVGCIRKDHKYYNLKDICNTALQLGVDYIEFDNLFSSQIVACELSWFMEKNEWDVAEKADAHFFPMPITQFKSPYELSEDHVKEVLTTVFDCKTMEEFMETFDVKQSLFDNCYVMDYIHTQMIPIATQEEKEEDITYFKKLSQLLSIIIVNKVKKSANLYTLIDPSTGELFTKNGSAYLLYTELYKYMGQFEYKKVDSFEEWIDRIQKKSVDHIVITDGPHGIAVIPMEMVQELATKEE